VQPHAEVRSTRPVMLNDWVRLSSRVYQLRHRP
jgi:hypothetical protein